MTLTFKKAKKQSYNEIGQQSVILFALALQEPDSNEIVEKFYPVKCRDFFNEVVWKQWTGQDYPIYGFKTDNFPVVEDETIYLTCHKVPSKVSFETYKNYLEAFDPDLEVTQIDDVMLVKIPKKYILYTFLISYLTFFIRCIERFDDPFDNSNWSGNELNYASSICSMTKRSVKEVHDAFSAFVKEYPIFDDWHGRDTPITTVGDNHNNTGIVATLVNKKNKFRKFCENFWAKEAA